MTPEIKARLEAIKARKLKEKEEKEDREEKVVPSSEVTKEKEAIVVHSTTSNTTSNTTPSTPSTTKEETPLEKIKRLKAERVEAQNLADAASITGTDIPKVVPAAVITKTTLAEKLAALKNKRVSSGNTERVAEEAAKLDALRAKSREKLDRLKRNTVDGSIPTSSVDTSKVALNIPESMLTSSTKGEVVEIENSPSTQLNKDQVAISDLNSDQQLAVKLAGSNESFNLIGSAGSGKTTTTRVIATELYNSGVIGTLPEDTKVLKKGSPSIIIVSFTNQAVRNIKEALPEEFRANCLTIHKVLEYSPVYYDITDMDGNTKKTMRFEPQRGIYNPIRGITHCIVEEAGSVSEDLFLELYGAVGRDTTFIYLGDLNQLPPVMGDAILGFKLLEHPIVELKHTYRQDSDSNIKKLAYRILDGKPIGDEELSTFHKEGELEIIKFKQRVAPDRATQQMGKHFQELVRKGEFIPGEDQVLIPFGKAGTLGATDLNKYIAQEESLLREVPVHEVIIGFRKEYFAVGDFVMFNKQKWQIKEIKKNSHYVGATPQQSSIHLDRWGNNPDILEASVQAIMSQEEMDEFFANIGEATSEDNKEAKKQCSHRFVLTCMDEERETEISTVGDTAELTLAYALTVHKSQGSEWQRVFCIFHESHAVMAKREILYTAVTRARKFLRIYYSGERPKTVNESFFQKGVVKQYIKGNTLEHKLEFFRSKVKVKAIKKLAAQKRGEAV